MEWNIAVPHNIVGPRQRYDDPFRNVMSIMINRNLHGKPSIIYGDGEQTRCFSYVQDCINCLEKMSLDPKITSQIINIGPEDGTISINELAKVVAECTGMKDSPIYMPDRPREVKHAHCSAGKAKRLLNFKPVTVVSEAVKETVSFIKNRGLLEFDYAYPIEIRTKKTPKTWTDKLI
jgi:UDP-glucose 4-epimerase